MLPQPRYSSPNIASLAIPFPALSIISRIRPLLHHSLRFSSRSPSYLSRSVCTVSAPRSSLHRYRTPKPSIGELIAMASPPMSPSSPPVVAGADAPAEELSKLFSTLSVDAEDSALVEELERISKESPKLIRSSEYKAPADPSIVLKSWKMNEFKYYDIPSPFPTLARGLFTQDIKDASGNVKHRIVARGYDKFFNIGEVPWTNVSIRSTIRRN